LRTSPPAAPAAAGQVAAATIRQMTGARTKIVWIRAPGGQGHPFGPFEGVPAPVWKIIVLDTEENRGKERELQSEPGTYNHCMITPTGTRVIWNDLARQTWIIDWDGKNKKPLQLPVGGSAVGVAENPPGTEWVYALEGQAAPGNGAAVYRYQIDDTSKKELVWNKTPSNDKWEFTRDGKYGASGLPWPNAGVAQLPNGLFKTFGVGCTPGVAADLSAMFHMIPNGHRGAVMYDKNGANPRQILYAQALGLTGTPDPQFWWTSFARYDGRFITFSGPHPSMRPASGDIYFCQLTPNHDAIAKYVQVTKTPELETQPYAWIEAPGAKRKAVKPAPAATGAAPGATSPGKAPGAAPAGPAASQ
jgi:hypothetical protein